MHVQPSFFNLIFIAISFSFFASCKKESAKQNVVVSFLKTTSPAPDHIIFVWLENKGFNKIIGNRKAPYINSLITQGTLYTNCFALTHPSYPNYIAFFAGTTNGIKNDDCLQENWALPNIYTSLNSAFKSFAWYSEDLPATGSTVCSAGNYVEKHNPTTLFANVPAAANKMFSQFPQDYNLLENVVCISPNLNNDMHDGTIQQADAWVQTKLGSLVEWCKTHNSIFVIYFDESERKGDNKIPVIAVGQSVKVNAKDSLYYTHYSWTKTILSINNAPMITNNVSNANTIKW